MDQTAREDIAQAAGRDNFHDRHQDRLLYAGDGTGKRYPPEAVVRATDADQVSRVLAACTRHKVPVVPRGAGSGLTGGALPVAGGVVLDMCGMNRILAVNAADQTAVVEPGVVTADLQAAAQAKGLFYPPDPASVGFCTIGGNVAENAGGLRAVKYGVTRDYVMGVTAILPDGRIFKTGGSTIKSVVGYDLTRLLVASEGTLAVMVRFIMRLLPKPEAEATISALFPRLEQAAEGVQQVLARGLDPTALEFIDAVSLEAVRDFADVDFPADREAMILVDLDGPPEVVERRSRIAEEILAGLGGDPVHVALDPTESETLWKARRALGPATFHLATGKFNEDVAVPLGKLAPMMRAIQGISQKRGLLIPTFGHAGDGNLHVNVMFDKSDPDQTARAHQAVSDVFAATLSLGGSLSGEHGVGIAKLGYVGVEMDPVAVELMRGIKKVFDPAGILNPHKKLPPPEVVP